MCKDLVSIGKILKPFGLRGEVKVSLLSDFPERFDALQSVVLEAPGGGRREYSVSAVRYGAPFMYMRFGGLDSIDDVQLLRGALVQIPEAERMSLPEGSYFHDDLVGLAVYLVKGNFLGTIEDIIEATGNDLFVVKGKEKEYLIPSGPETVKEVDLKQKCLFIDPVEGLLDL
ncbi:MAG: ribosome maturation factor RimM [Nitrospiria bacterium]